MNAIDVISNNLVELQRYGLYCSGIHVECDEYIYEDNKNFVVEGTSRLTHQILSGLACFIQHGFNMNKDIDATKGEY